MHEFEDIWIEVNLGSKSGTPFASLMFFVQCAAVLDGGQIYSGNTCLKPMCNCFELMDAERSGSTIVDLSTPGTLQN